MTVKSNAKYIVFKKISSFWVFTEHIITCSVVFVFPYMRKNGFNRCVLGTQGFPQVGALGGEGGGSEFFS